MPYLIHGYVSISRLPPIQIENHAIKVLKGLGLEDCFDQIICFETMNLNLSKSMRPNEFFVLLKLALDVMKIALHITDVDPYYTASKRRGICLIFQFLHILD